jgi:hypothetical protein
MPTLPENQGASGGSTPEGYLWAVFNAALLMDFVQALLYDTPLYPYCRVAFGVAFVAFAAFIVSAIVRLVRRRRPTALTAVTATRILLLLPPLFLSHEKRDKQIAVSGVTAQLRAGV